MIYRIIMTFLWRALAVIQIGNIAKICITGDTGEVYTFGLFHALLFAWAWHEAESWKNEN